LPGILGIGTDIEDAGRFRKHVTGAQSVSLLISDVFSPEEIRRNLSFKNPYLCFAFGFSCKEALFKALGRSWLQAPLSWADMECLFDEAPPTRSFRINLSGGAGELFKERGGQRIEAEMECENDHVIVRVVLWK
jgi:phosphopantetheine--protein transferase-like protein